MGYYEKDGRLFDPVTHADRGPAKARLDADRTAKGETRIVQHVPGENPDLVCQDGRFSLARFPEHEDRNGNRTPLAAQPETVKPKLSSEIRALLFMSAGRILGPTVTYGKSLEQLARGMREMPADFNPHRYESVPDLSWHERKARSSDWLAVYERGS